MEKSKEPTNNESSKKNYITVCICTYKRKQLLKKLILELENQIADGSFKFDVVIVDNDPLKSAETTVAELKSNSNLEIHYFHEPKRSISFARNRSIKEAKGDFIAFIDDDEFPISKWLTELFTAIIKYNAEGVLGPVKPYIDDDIPEWLVKSGLLIRKSFETGYIINNSRNTRTGNVLLKSELFYNEKLPFDPKYGKIGGGDVDFFHRMMLKGKKFVWCEEAVAYEIIAPERRTKNYYFKRSFTRGYTASMKVPVFSLSTLKSLIAIILYALIIPFCAICGQHLFMKYAIKLCDHFSKILGYFGIQIVKERPYLHNE